MKTVISIAALLMFVAAALLIVPLPGNAYYGYGGTCVSSAWPGYGYGYGYATYSPYYYGGSTGWNGYNGYRSGGAWSGRGYGMGRGLGGSYYGGYYR